MEVPLIFVPVIGVQPRYARSHQIGSETDTLEGNKSEQPANRRQRFASTDRHKDGVAFSGVQVRLCG